MKINIKFIIFYLSIILILGSCKSTDKVETRTPDKIFEEAVELFNTQEYLESKKLLDIIRLQYPASQYIDDAQFYLAEIDFKMEKYIYAAFSYNRLRQVYPSSDFAKQSLFNAALSYYMLSPSYNRDQEYTKKSMQAFMEYQFLYPGDSLAEESGKKIDELRSKLAEKEYETARLYIKLSNPRGSLIYFDSVLNDYDDTKFFEPAFAGKIEVLYKLKRFDEATGLIDLYKKQFPNGTNLNVVESIENQINSKL